MQTTVTQPEVDSLVRSLMNSPDLLITTIFENNPEGTKDAFATFTTMYELGGIEAQIQAFNKLLESDQKEVCQNILHNIKFLPENTENPELWDQVLAAIHFNVSATTN